MWIADRTDPVIGAALKAGGNVLIVDEFVDQDGNEIHRIESTRSGVSIYFNATTMELIEHE